MTFSGNTTSLGYSASEEAKLNVIIRTPGGAWRFLGAKDFRQMRGQQPAAHPDNHDVHAVCTASVFSQCRRRGDCGSRQGQFSWGRVRSTLSLTAAVAEFGRRPPR